MFNERHLEEHEEHPPQVTVAPEQKFEACNCLITDPDYSCECE